VQTGSRAARVDAEALDAAYFAEGVVCARARAFACASARTSARSRACARNRVCRSGRQRQLKAPRQHDGVRRRLARELVGDALHDGRNAKDQHDVCAAHIVRKKVSKEELSPAALRRAAQRRKCPQRRVQFDAARAHAAPRSTHNMREKMQKAGAGGAAPVATHKRRMSALHTETV
jgi:hypothetical protein